MVELGGRLTYLTRFPIVLELYFWYLSSGLRVSGNFGACHRDEFIPIPLALLAQARP